MANDKEEWAFSLTALEGVSEIESADRFGAVSSADVERLGERPMRRVTLERGGEAEEVLASADARWFVKRGGGLVTYQTYALEPGLRVPGAGEGLTATGEESDSDWVVSSVGEWEAAEAYAVKSASGSFSTEKGALLRCPLK